MPAIQSHHFDHLWQAGLNGSASVAGDKSISHRAVILSALAQGTSQIDHLLEGDDVLATIEAFRAMGVEITRSNPGSWRITGSGLGALREADQVLDMGNSGTAMRLMMGVLAGQKMRSFLTGDHSLVKRPMQRIADPLWQMGAKFYLRDEKYAPLLVDGSDHLLPIHYEMAIPSAQIKSALLLAALNAYGTSEIVEPVMCRDHSERMIAARGGQLDIVKNPQGEGRLIRLTGGAPLSPQDITVPGDPSSAAFLAVAGLIVPNSKICLNNIGMNPTRTGLFEALTRMGAKIEFSNRQDVSGEPTATLTVQTSTLNAVSLDAAIAPSMIDEYPILSIAASFAKGTSRFEGLSELRVKESDRLAAIVAGLEANGVVCRHGADWLEIDGCGQNGVKGGGTVVTHFDHRIAMSFLIMGLAAKHPIIIDDDGAIKTSFPEFTTLITRLGGKFIAG